ncbi:hypothetical protein FH968_23265 [Buttiauxella sp. B2]|uniref:hypothetical protein n=1 Tax=Buttiauxella sp. B2 TaxID=2587812 RepID=UPI0011245DC6|nr:hypothetical protein [Buttiauxella sp. B2]TNV09596.1 hypothetical protein FH968_23265 [Buttiauxella sp. B2]
MKMNTGNIKKHLPIIILFVMIVAFSAYVKSWGLLYVALATSVIILLPLIVSPFKHSKYILFRALRLLVNTCWAIGLVCVFFSFIERLVWVNTETYPTWLAKELVSPSVVGVDNMIKATEFFDKTCGKNRGYLTVVAKRNGTFMRCDDSISFDSWWKGVYLLKTPENG